MTVVHHEAHAAQRLGPLARVRERCRVGLRSAMGAAMSAFAIRIAGAGVAYALHIALARALGPAEFGLWGLSWTIILIVGHAASLGFSESVIRYVGGYTAQEDWGRARGALICGAVICLAFGLGLALLGVSVLLAARGLVPEGAFLPLLLAVAAWPLFALQDWMEGVGRALGRPALALAPGYVFRPLLIGVCALAIAFGGSFETATAAMAATLAALALAALAQAIWLLRVLPREIRAARPTFESFTWLRASAPLALVFLFDQTAAFTDVLALGVFASAEETGAYFAASRLAALAALGTYAVAVVSGRRFAQHHACGEREALEESVRQAALWTLLATLMAVVTIGACGRFLLALFGPDFVAAAPALVILLTGVLARAAGGQAEELLIMVGRQNDVVRIAFIAGTFAVAATFLAAPLFGALGVACAMAAAGGLRAALAVSAARRLVGVRAGFAFNLLRTRR
jgi:O-antigen/teichoic acid export membrane protein